MRRFANTALGLAFALASCGAPLARSQIDAGATAAPQSATPAEAALEPYVWQPVTRSPQTPEPSSDALARACPVRDAALERVAAYAAGRELAGSGAVDAEDVTLVLRAEGSPYVWPRIWSLSGINASREAAPRYASWLAASASKNERCGAAVARDAAGREVVVGVALDVLADLDALPTHAAIGAWLEVSARLLVPTASVEVVVLGPRGAAHSVPSSFDGTRVRARFHADREGPYTVQLLANVEGGPRPVAEAVVMAGEAPATLRTSTEAPGEDARHDADTARGIAEMINGARASEGVARLSYDPRLERVARAHAEAMRASGRLAHDAGDGSPDERLTAAGIAARAVGENVAHAADAVHAHRTLWQSPSHRSNLLERRYDTVGVGVATGEDGTLWVCELFAQIAGT